MFRIGPAFNEQATLEVLGCVFCVCPHGRFVNVCATVYNYKIFIIYEYVLTILTVNCIYNAPVPVLETSSKHSTASHQSHNT